MEAVTTVTHGFGAVLLPMPPAPVPCVPTSESLHRSLETYKRDGWRERDFRFRGLPKMLRDRVATDLDFITVEDLKRHEYYRDFLEPLGLRWFAAVNMSIGEQTWILSIQRGVEMQPFSAAEQRQLVTLSQRLSTAGALVEMLSFARLDAALGAFEASGTAAIMLDRLGSVIRVSSAANRLLGPALQIAKGRVAPTDRQAATALDKAMQNLLRDGSPSVFNAPVVLPRVEGAPVLAYLMRLEGISRDAFAPCQALIILRDMAERLRPPHEDLRRAFGLTPAEARLAQCIAGGDSLESAAAELGVAVQTARNQLKAVFAKTGAARQSELVAMMARMIAIPSQ